MSIEGRRSFLGGIMLSVGGAAAANIAKPIEVTGRLLAPNEEIADKIANAKDGEIVIATPEDVRRMETGPISRSNWFGVPDGMVRGMSASQYGEWLHRHLEVNRSMGLNAAEYAYADFSTDEFLKRYMGGDYN